jgi:hypothetical protein
MRWKELPIGQYGSDCEFGIPLLQTFLLCRPLLARKTWKEYWLVGWEWFRFVQYGCS